MPAYSSATFRTVVARVLPPRTSSASSSRRPWRNRSTSIRTDVSSSKCITILSGYGNFRCVPAFLVGAEMGDGLRFASAGAAPRRSRYRPVQDDPCPSTRCPYFPESAAAFAGEVPGALFPLRKSCVHEDQPENRFLSVDLRAAERGRASCSYVYSECALLT